MDKLIEEYFNIVNKKPDVLKEGRDDYREDDPFYYRTPSHNDFWFDNQDSYISEKDIGTIVSYYDPADPTYGDETIKAKILGFDPDTGKAKIQPVIKDEKKDSDTYGQYIDDPDETPIFVQSDKLQKEGDESGDTSMEIDVDPKKFDQLPDPDTDGAERGDSGWFDDHFGLEKHPEGKFDVDKKLAPRANPKDLDLVKNENMNIDNTNNLEDLSLDVHFGKQETVNECGDSCNCDGEQCKCDKEGDAQPQDKSCKCGKKPHRKFFNKQPEKTPESQIKESLEKGFAF